MDFIEDGQPVLMIREVQLWIGEPGEIRGRFKVEVHRVQGLGNLQGKGRLANLSRSDQSDGRVIRQQVVQLRM